MIRYARRTAAFCLLLLVGLLVQASRIQVLKADEYGDNPANRRGALTRYEQPRGDVKVAGVPITGTRETGGRLAFARTYTRGELYAPVTGYASQTYGTTLLEAAEDDVLSGAAPELAPVPWWSRLTREQQPGGDVWTTILPAAQRAAFTGLGARKGAVAAVEPATGRILALVSTPSYDPSALAGTGPAVRDAWSRLQADADRPLLNRAIHRTYPPGSAFTVVTAAAALERGVVEDIDAPTGAPGPYQPAGAGAGTAADGCADATLRYAFEMSCDTVFAKLGVDVGPDAMAGQAEAFGFNDEEWRIPPRVAASRFGTGTDGDALALSSVGRRATAATPLQMAMVAAAVANGGELMRPRLVDRITDADGDTVSATRPARLGKAMSKGTARLLREMMAGVVTGGTGTDAAIAGATVGGRTGAAQTGATRHGGADDEGTRYAWFIGWARSDGADVPAVAVAVVVEGASAGRARISGGGDAAPVARAVMRAVLD